MHQAEVADELRALAKDQTPEVALDVLKCKVLPWIEGIRSARKMKRESESVESEKNKKQRRISERENPDESAELEGPIFENLEVPWLQPGAPNTNLPAQTVVETDFDESHPLYSILKQLDHSDKVWLTGRIRQLFREPDKLKRGAGHIAAYWGNKPMLKFLLLPLGDRKPLWDIHQAAQGGWTAIHFAAARGHLECVHLCIKAGSKVNVATIRGRKTPLKLAQDQKHHELISFLKSKGGRIREDAAAFDDVWDRMQLQVKERTSEKKIKQAPEDGLNT